MQREKVWRCRETNEDRVGQLGKSRKAGILEAKRRNCFKEETVTIAQPVLTGPAKRLRQDPWI